MTDTENDTHLSTTTKNDFIAEACAETWDKIIAAGLAEKHCKTQDFSTVAGQLAYSLGSIITDGDFYKASQLYVNEGNGQFRPVSHVNSAEVQSFRAPTSVVSMRLHYIPCAPTFKSAGSYSDAATFDGISGWEEHALLLAAIKVKSKREEDSSTFYRRKQEVEQRILSSGSTDWSGPGRVVRRRGRPFRDPFWVYQNNVNAYLIRGDKLELMYLHGYIP
jgi:hypothetical protein